MEKTYLGDAVYASYDGYQIELTTEDGLQVTNRIYLEPQVLEAFSRYTKQIADRIRWLTEGEIATIRAGDAPEPGRRGHSVRRCNQNQKE